MRKTNVIQNLGVLEIILFVSIVVNAGLAILRERWDVATPWLLLLLFMFLAVGSRRLAMEQYDLIMEQQKLIAALFAELKGTDGAQ